MAVICAVIIAGIIMAAAEGMTKIVNVTEEMIAIVAVMAEMTGIGREIIPVAATMMILFRLELLVDFRIRVLAAVRARASKQRGKRHMWRFLNLQNVYCFSAK